MRPEGALLECRDNRREECIRTGAVEQAVIEGQREIDHRPDGDRIAHHDHPLLYGAHPKDSRLRLRDDRGGEEPAAHAMVGDGEGPAAQLIRGELPRPCVAGQVAHLRRQPPQRLLLGIAHHRDDQTLLAEQDGQADVNLALKLHSLLALTERLTLTEGKCIAPARLGAARHVGSHNCRSYSRIAAATTSATSRTGTGSPAPRAASESITMQKGQPTARVLAPEARTSA